MIWANRFVIASTSCLLNFGNSSDGECLNRYHACIDSAVRQSAHPNRCRFEMKCPDFGASYRSKSGLYVTNYRILRKKSQRRITLPSPHRSPEADKSRCQGRKNDTLRLPPSPYLWKIPEIHCKELLPPPWTGLPSSPSFLPYSG